MTPEQIRVIAEHHNLTKKQAELLIILADVVEATKEHLKSYNYGGLEEALTRLEVLKPWGL